MRRPSLPLALLLLALLLAGLVALWQAGEAGGWLPWSAGRAEPGEAESLGARDEAVLADLERRLVLRGLPGVEVGAQGEGALAGAVRLHVPGQPPRPLAGVRVLVLSARPGVGRPRAPAGGPEGGSGGGEPAAQAASVETDAQGAFLLPALAAGGAYALVVRHPPYREVVRRGVAVLRDRVNDVGEILLGAPTTLAGEVLDAAGRPVGGARVQVLADTSRPDRFDLHSGLFELLTAADPLAEARAQGDGRFVVSDLSPGRYVLRVTAPGFATAFRSDVRVTLDERSGSVRVVLDPGAGWYGVVRDEDGRALPGARLVAAALPGERLQRLDRVDVEAGADGGYRLDTLVDGVRYFVETWAEGYAPTGQVLVAQGVARRDVTVVRAGRVEGRVTDRATGAPVEGAQVTLLAGQATTLSPVSTVSGPDGGYVLAHVAPGPLLLLSVRAAGYEAGGLDAGALAGRRVVAGETQGIDVTLARGATVGGRIVGEDGRPVAYATVALLDPRRRWDGEASSISDLDGRYLVTGLRAGTYEVRVAAPGYAPITDEQEARVVVPPDLAPVTRDLRLSLGAVLVGRVRTPEGGGAAGAVVEVRAAGPPELRARVRDLDAITDPNGAFRLLGVPTGVDLVVSAAHDDWVRGTLRPLRLTPGQTQEVALVLRAGASLPGRVVDAQGRAVADARVRWGAITPDNEERVGHGDAFRADEALGQRVLRTDADGRFLLERLEPGRLLLKVEREGFADWYRRDLVMGAEGPQPALTVTLEGALAVRGRVTVAEAGTPIEGAWVYAEENRPGGDEPQDPGRVRALVAVQTGADGTYRLDRLPPGRYKVAVWLALGFQNRSLRDVAAGSSGVDFALEPLPPPPAR